jgi:RNA polymerase sigma-70 factor (ECF subfamily)
MRHEARLWGGRALRASPREAPDAPGRTTLFVRLLSRYERQINGYVLSLVPNWADADEVAQETKVRLWEQFDAYDPSRDFGAWACTVAHYQVMTYRRRQGRERARFGDAFLQAVSAEATASSGELESRHRAVERCLENLNGEQVSLLRRCYAGMESLRQIADRSGLSLDTVRKELLRLRRLLAHCVEKSRQAEGNA